jgi:hypothetical protein
MLVEALTNQASHEKKRRLETLLLKLTPEKLGPKEVRELRSIELLEHMATPDANSLLRELASGAPEARTTRSAQGALQRLAKAPGK